jgi:predicted enzyme related to lactoylglutathione lyase
MEVLVSASLVMVNLDGPDPRAQAAFYGALLDWTIVHSEDEYAMISGVGAPIGFGRVDGYVPPPWPDPEARKRYHLDLGVDDLAAATERAVQLGATVPDEQPGEGRWTVLLDPVGHPFCLCQQ